MNNPLHWLYQQSSQCITCGSEQCYLCGHDCTDSHSVAKGIADTFNSHVLAQRRSSAYLCDACAWYLDSKAGHADYRKMSLVVTEHTWRNWRRTEMKADIARWLKDGLEDDAYLVCSLSKKKHILMQSLLNARGSRQFAVQVEEQIAHVDFATWLSIETAFMGLLEMGHGKGEILSGNLYANTLRKHGRLMEAMRLSQQLDPWRDSPLIELYSYTTILDEKEEATDDRSGRRDSSIDGRTAGNATDRYSSPPAHGGVEEHRSRVQEPVSSGNMAAVRGTHQRVSTYDRDVTSVPQPSLWDATDSDLGDG